MANVLTLQWQDQQYDLNLDKVTSRQWDQVEIHTRLIDDQSGVVVEPGLTAGDILVAVGMGSMRSVSGRMGKALLWLFKSQSGNPAAFEDDIPTLEFYAALSKAVGAGAAGPEAGEAGEDEAAPKGGSTKSSRGASSRRGSSSAS